ncbi:hypothetical protein Nepgr_016907 [Nepenthes gracilis]|uniref:DYW domain-containing protein n=1 Tax=Nepenthes gracilis TaxID=150966 RepID=A0AAD3SRI3_NEPGR|nr:hypothetical protein Nepgr_016907 [Nepenthes gracilis]
MADSEIAQAHSKCHLMSYLGTLARKISNYNHLRQLHAHIVLNSLRQSNYWVSLLISHCTSLKAPPSYARRIFNSVPWPNVFAYTSMLKFYFQLGAHHDVLSLFQEMRGKKVRPDAFVFPMLIKSAGKSAIRFHAHVLKLGLVNDHFVRNAIMGMYASFGPIELARELFDQMPDRAIADWNLLISGYWKWGLEMKARELFDLMPAVNVVTWTAMVTGYSRMKDLESARRYFDGMPEKTVVSWNAMLSGYAQNGFNNDALRLFDDMLDAGVQPDETTWVTVISSCSSHGDPCFAEVLFGKIHDKKIPLNCFVKTALIDLSAKCGNLLNAKTVFDELGVHRNSVTWNVMISAYMRVGDLTTARELFDKMPEKNVVSWNSMISGYAQNGQSPLAIELFKEMIAISHSKPDEVTMVSVLSACGHLGALELGNWVAAFLIEARIELSISGYNALIFMYTKCGSMKDAQKIFQEMSVRDVVSYNTLISGLAAHGHGDGAIELFAKMSEEGIHPDRITFIGVLTACSHAGLLEEGRKIYESINSPTVDHYACMVDLLGRVGELDEAVRLVERMPVEPHAGVYGSLLSASRIHKNVEIGEFAANKLFELEPNNSGNYILLSNIYAAASRWEDERRVREAMVKKGVKKATGWSWVEYGGKMHKFLAGDRSHEWSDAIYKVMAELRRKMRCAGYVSDKSCALPDIEEEEKEESVGVHSERLAIGFALLVSSRGSVIRVMKNLRPDLNSLRWWWKKSGR